MRASPLAELRGAGAHVVVRTPDPDGLSRSLGTATVAAQPDGSLLVDGLSAADVGRAAFAAGVELHELRTVATELEDVFLDLTRDEPAGAA